MEIETVKENFSEILDKFKDQDIRSFSFEIKILDKDERFTVTRTFGLKDNVREIVIPDKI